MFGLVKIVVVHVFVQTVDGIEGVIHVSVETVDRVNQLINVIHQT